MTITALPPLPSRNNAATFAEDAAAFFGALPHFGSEIDATVVAVDASALAAAASADAAAGSATISGATIWVSGTTYAIGNARFSPINFQTYRRKTAGAGTTDPSTDTTNWARVDLSVLAGGTLLVANGGTSATTAAGARANLGAAASGANADVTSLSKVTGLGNNATTHVQITAAGLVGIGALPSYKFDVVDTATATVARFKTSSVAAGASAALVVAAGATNQASLTVDNATSQAQLTASAALGLRLTAGTVLSQYAGTMQDFYTAGVKRMSLDAAGNVNFQAAGSSLNNVSAINGGQLAGFRNRILNGALQIRQRGTSFAITVNNTAEYTVDGWYAWFTGLTGTPSLSILLTTWGTTGVNVLRLQGGAALETICVAQKVESYNCVGLAIGGGSPTGIPCTFSALVACDQTGIVTWSVYRPNSNIRDTYGTVAVPTKTLVATGTWNANGNIAKYSATFTSHSACDIAGMEVVISTAITSGYLHVGQLQLEAGQFATPYEHRGIGLELALCQRYYIDTGLYFVGDDARPSYLSYAMRATPTVVGGGAGFGLNGSNVKQTTAGLAALRLSAEL